MESKKDNRTREEVAAEEVGRTDISPAQKWFLTLMFLGMILIIPVVDLSSLRISFDASTFKGHLDSLEKETEDSSILKDQLTERTQKLFSMYLKTGTESAVVGNHGRLYYRPDIECQYKAIEAETVQVITHFRDQLKEKGIQLIVLPVPVKPQTEREILSGLRGGELIQNSGFEDFLRKLSSNNVEVLDLTDSLMKNKVTSRKHQYLATDTHWTPEAMSYCAAQLAEVIRGKGIKGDEKYQTIEKNISNSGDIARMLKLDLKEEVQISRIVNWKQDKRSPVLLLGDSFSNIYSSVNLDWGDSAGFPEHLSYFLGMNIDAIRRNDGGASATREMLSADLRNGSRRLEGKKIVIWQFAVRELVFGDWKEVPLIDGKAKNEIPEFSRLKVKAVIKEVSGGPKKNSPYKDFFRSAVLTDVESDAELPLEISIRLLSMKNNEFTTAANLQKGDWVSLELTPWDQQKFGSVKRSEFDDFDLIEMPVYAKGELVTEVKNKSRVNLLYLLFTVLGIASAGALFQRKKP